MESYQSRFLELFGYGPQLMETQLVSRFIQGLNDDIRYQVDAGNPGTLAEAARIASIFEAGSKKRASSNFTPRPNDRTKKPFVPFQSRGSFNNGGAQRPNENSLGRGPTGLKSMARDVSASPALVSIARKHKLCIKCLGGGHFAHECRSPPASQAKKDAVMREHGGANAKANRVTLASGAEETGKIYAAFDKGTLSNQLSILEVELIFSEEKVRALVDSGSSHSFVHPRIVEKLGLETLPRADLVVELANGSRQTINRVVNELSFHLGGGESKACFHELPLGHFDVILGMDWLRKVRAKIHCHDRKLVWDDDKGVSHEIGGLRNSLKVKVMSQARFMKMNRVDKGVVFALFFNKPKEGGEVIPEEDFPILREFRDVFPEKLPGLPPMRELDHVIDLSPEAKPVAIPPYRFAPPELAELRSQLDEIIREWVY